MCALASASFLGVVHDMLLEWDVQGVHGGAQVCICGAGGAVAVSEKAQRKKLSVRLTQGSGYDFRVEGEDCSLIASVMVWRPRILPCRCRKDRWSRARRTDSHRVRCTVFGGGDGVCLDAGRPGHSACGGGVGARGPAAQQMVPGPCGHGQAACKGRTVCNAVLHRAGTNMGDTLSACGVLLNRYRFRLIAG